MTRTLVLAAALAATAAASAHAQAVDSARSPRPIPTGAFLVDQAVTVSGTPEQAFAAITGEVSTWWDHHVFPRPRRLYLEPRVGGCFCEEADTLGNGVRHAVVTVVDRPKLLVYEGPLGLVGNAVSAVTTYSFTPRGDSTEVRVQFHAVGEVRPGIPEAVDGVWRHFLAERFKPWYERTRGRR